MTVLPLVEPMRISAWVPDMDLRLLNWCGLALKMLGGNVTIYEMFTALRSRGPGLMRTVPLVSLINRAEESVLATASTEDPDIN